MAWGVPKYVHTLHCDETVRHHLIQDGAQPLNVFFCVYDFHDDWQILGKPQDVCRVDDTARAEACHAMKDSRPSESLLAKALQQRDP